MPYTEVTWAFREVATSAKLNAMAANDAWLKEQLELDSGVIVVGSGTGIAPAYAANFSAYVDSTWNGLRFRKRGNVVALHGGVAKTSATVLGDNITTLPAEFRPAFSVQLASSGGSWVVNTAGQVQCRAAGPSSFSLGGTWVV